MKIKDNKGFTGVDISIAIVILMLFIPLITVLYYNFTITSKSNQREAEATSIAVNKLEEYKAMEYGDITTGTFEEVQGEYKVTTIVESYKETTGNSDIADVIKKVKVTVNYWIGKKENKVEMETVITSNKKNIAKDGLILHLDAIDNTANGHNQSTTVWEDLSENGNNGTVTGAIWGSNSIYFDGVNDWVNCGEINNQYITMEITFSPTEIGRTQEFFGNWQTGGGGIGIDAEGQVYCNAHINGDYRIVKAPNACQANNIYHVIATYDGTTEKIYVNGVLVDQISVSGSITAPVENTVVSIGSNPVGSEIGTALYKGYVYSAKIYNRALTEEEVLQNYEYEQERYNIKETQIATNGLVLYLDGINNTGSGHSSNASIWKDLSGRENNGSVSGGTWDDNSLYFDGVNDWVNCGEINSDYMTLEATMSANKTGQSMVALGNIEAGGGAVGVTAAGSLFGQFYINSAYQQLTKSGGFNLNQIYHVVVTYDGANERYYVNGDLVNEFEELLGVIKAPASNTVMALGTNPGPSGNVESFNGRIYEAKIYNRGLTSAEVLKNYNYEKERYGIQE